GSGSATEARFDRYLVGAPSARARGGAGVMVSVIRPPPIARRGRLDPSGRRAPGRAPCGSPRDRSPRHRTARWRRGPGRGGSARPAASSPRGGTCGRRVLAPPHRPGRSPGSPRGARAPYPAEPARARRCDRSYRPLLLMPWRADLAPLEGGGERGGAPKRGRPLPPVETHGADDPIDDIVPRGKAVRLLHDGRGRVDHPAASGPVHSGARPPAGGA